MRRAENYRVVYADLDTEDWKRPGVDAIVQGRTAGSREGGGGDDARRWWRPLADCEGPTTC